MSKKKRGKGLFKTKKMKLILCAVIAGAVLVVGIPTGIGIKNATRKPPEIISVSTLEKVVNVSDLSTSTVVYKGIAKVMNKEKPEKIDYYVAYEARVKAGIDFNNVEITVDQETKAVNVIIPQIKLTDVDVDIASLDFMFENDKANTATVSQEAYAAAEKDVTEESLAKSEIIEIAHQNAVKVITGLLKPFIDTVDGEYTLNVQ